MRQTLLSFFRETRASTKSREFICGYKAWIQTIGGDARWRALGKSPSSVACQQESCSRTGELGDAPFSLKVHCKDGQSTIEDLVWQDKRGQEAIRKGDWAAYGQEQKRVEEALRRLREGH